MSFLNVIFLFYISWWVCSFFYDTYKGKSYDEHFPLYRKIWVSGLLLSLCLAIYTYITTGQASCLDMEQSPYGSYCLEYADDGYTWTKPIATLNAFESFKNTVIVGSGTLFIFRLNKIIKGDK